MAKLSIISHAGVERHYGDIMLKSSIVVNREGQALATPNAAKLSPSQAEAANF